MITYMLTKPLQGELFRKLRKELINHHPTVTYAANCKPEERTDNTVTCSRPKTNPNFHYPSKPTTTLWSENLEREHHGARYWSEKHHGARTMERDLGARILELGPLTGIYGARTLDWTLDRNLDSIILSNQKAERIFIAYYCLTINSLSSCLTLLLVRVSQNVRY